MPPNLGVHLQIWSGAIAVFKWVDRLNSLFGIAKEDRQALFEAPNKSGNE